MRRRERIASFALVTATGIEGVMIYRAALPAPGLISSSETSLAMNVRIKHQVLTSNPGLSDGENLGPFQYCCQGGALWITLPVGTAAPSPERPVEIEYFSDAPR